MDPHGRTFRELEYLRLNNDPDYFKDEYDRARAFFLEQTKKPAPKEESTEQKAPATPPVKSQERAPLLEAAGPASEPQEIAQQQKLRRKKADALASGSVEDIADFLGKSGLLNHLA